MSRRVLIGVFAREEDILGMTRAARRLGLQIIDAYTPYAVHGLDRAMGLRESRIPWVCLLFALLGATFKVWFEYWTTALDWPINVGGKPWNSLPAFVPVTFEVMVLCAGVSTVVSLFATSRLAPGKRPTPAFPGATNDRFVLVIEETDAAFDPDAVKRLCADYDAVHVEERMEEPRPAVQIRPVVWRWVNIVLGLMLIGLLILAWAGRPDPSRPNYEFLPDMAHSPAYSAFAPNPHLPDGTTLQPPPPGAIARGQPPLHYQPSPEDAARAGEQLRNPFSPAEAQALERGAFIYANFCTPCHGPAGLGDGPVARRGVPPPPSLLADHARTIRDGQIFHLLTYGQGNMPPYASQLSREDRWKVVLHIRGMQKEAAQAPGGTKP